MKPLFISQLIPTRKLTRIFLAILILATALSGQQSPAKGPAGIGNLDSVSADGNTITIRSGDSTVIAQVVEPNVLRVHYRPQDKTSPPTAVLDPNHVWPRDIPAKIETNSDPIVISTERMTVKIARAPVRFSIYDNANHQLLQEPAEGGVYAGGLRFRYNSASPFFGVEGTAIPGQNVDAHQDVRAGVWRSGGAARAGRQGDAGAPLAHT